MTTTKQAYREIRAKHPHVPARYALQMAHHRLQVDVLETAVEWEDVFSERVVAVAHFVGFDIVVYNDDEPYDWGDIEPTEHEREDLQVIGVGVRIAGEADDDLDSIWGVAFLDGDYERLTLSTALECGFIDRALEEIRERAYWAACDVVTV